MMHTNHIPVLGQDVLKEQLLADLREEAKRTLWPKLMMAAVSLVDSAETAFAEAIRAVGQRHQADSDPPCTPELPTTAAQSPSTNCPEELTDLDKRRERE